MGKSTAKLVWVDQITDDTNKTAEFYSALFNSGKIPVDEGNGRTSYSMTDQSGEEVFGIVEESVFPDWAHGWVLYFEVDDFESCRAKIKSQGGNVIRQTAKQCLFRDPSGAPVVVQAKAE